MLSTRFGYLRPAAAASDLALRFCAVVNGIDFPRFLGRGRAHIGKGFMAMSSFCMPYSNGNGLWVKPNLAQSWFAKANFVIDKSRSAREISRSAAILSNVSTVLDSALKHISGARAL